MIIAEVVPEKGFVFVKFIEPGENPARKPYITTHSMEDAELRISFSSRKHITEKLTAWLKQRAHALPHAQSEINMMLSWISEVRLRGLSYVCDFVSRRRPQFESIAPASTSKCYPYYQANILTILNYCSDYKIDA
ncbi:MAG TPA: hypothetical protein VF679_01625 [Pedobacter sp.]|jgi:hypothetical protein